MADWNLPTNQIVIIKTNKKLIALYDKLKVASRNTYAQLHAKGEEENDNGSKITSLIGVTIQDYSNGTGENSIFASFNLAPEQVQFLLTRLAAGFVDYEWNSEKIFGKPDANGYAIAQKFFISRHAFDRDGKPLRSPWRISVSNGRGIKVKNQTGGSYMKGGSYVPEKEAFICLSDMDMYMLLKRADAYISLFEMYEAGKGIGEGRILYERYVSEHKNAAAAAAPVPCNAAPAPGQYAYGYAQPQTQNAGAPGVQNGYDVYYRAQGNYAGASYS